MDNRKLGKFKIYHHDIQRNPDKAKAVMAECIIVRAESMYHENTIAYIAISDLFEIVPYGKTVPVYRVLFKNLTNDLNTFEFQKEES
uniref:Uncharacterized protein n=1 Tax=viral metagenome TaxID=1070528 RepID=A0A6H1Z9W2_9ZZZZ